MTPIARSRDESGTALVELALVLPVLLLVVLGIVDFGRAFNYWIDSTHLANVAARYATVNTNPGGPSSVSLQRHIELQANTPELRDGGPQVDPPVDVCVSFPDGTSNVGDPVKVTVRATYKWLGFIVDRAGLSPSTQLAGSATMRLEAKPTNYTAGCA